MNLGRNIFDNAYEWAELNLGNRIRKRINYTFYLKTDNLRSSVYNSIREVRFILIMKLFEIIDLHNR